MANHPVFILLGPIIRAFIINLIPHQFIANILYIL